MSTNYFIFIHNAKNLFNDWRDLVVEEVHFIVTRTHEDNYT